MSLFERRDVIIVASVSCIYGLGDPEDYSELVVSLRLGQKKPQEEILHKLVDIQYSRNDMNLERGTFRVHGDTIEVFPAAFDNSIIRIEMFGDEIDRLTEVDVLTGEVIASASTSPFIRPAIMSRPGTRWNGPWGRSARNWTNG